MCIRDSSGSGKTSVIEAMAYRAGITNRIGTGSYTHLDVYKRQHENITLI